MFTEEENERYIGVDAYQPEEWRLRRVYRIIIRYIAAMTPLVSEKTISECF